MVGCSFPFDMDLEAEDGGKEFRFSPLIGESAWRGFEELEEVEEDVVPALFKEGE